MRLINTLLASARLPFLILAPASVAVAWGYAEYQSINWTWQMVVFCMVGALLSHIAVNALNEYEDFKSGLDLNTKQTPFSGGSGALPAVPGHADAVKLLGYGAVSLAIIMGLYVAIVFGWKILPVGAVGILIILTYTPLLNKHPMLCLFAPGASFGLLIPLASFFVLSGDYSSSLLLVCIPIVLLVNNLLLLNQFPDKSADTHAGRRHLIIAFGSRAGVITYAIQITAATLLFVVNIVNGLFPDLMWLLLLPLGLGFVAAFGAAKYSNDIGYHPGFMGANVGCAVGTPALFGLLLLLGS